MRSCRLICRLVQFAFGLAFKRPPVGRVLGLVMLCFFFGTSAQTVPREGFLTLSKAELVVTVAGQSRRESVELPYFWDSQNRGQQGQAVFTLNFELAEVPPEGWALDIPKLGNAYEIRLNGVLLDRRGVVDRHNGEDYGHMPQFVPVTPGLLKTFNQIEIRLRADNGRRSGLSLIMVGPDQKMHDDFEYRYRLHAIGTGVVSAFSLGIAILCLGLWMSQVRRQRESSSNRIYLYAALAELSWCFGVGFALIDRPPITWPWWGMLWSVSFGTWLSCTMLFLAETTDWRQSALAQPWRYWLVALLLVCPFMAYLALSAGWAFALTLWYVVMYSTCLGFFALYFNYTLRRGSTEHWIASIAILLNLAAGLRDLYVQRFTHQYPEITLLRFSSLAFGVTVGYLVIMHFRAANVQVQELVQTMSERIAEKELALETSYRSMEGLMRQQERSAERTSILRDMHDGVGAHLSMAIRQIESQQSSPSQLLPTLRDSLDQLKLTIDTMNLLPGDVVGLLANLRYRLGPRLEAAGIQVNWQVDSFEPVKRIDAQGLRQLMFILFEAFSNVVQHAHAKCLLVQVRQAGTNVEMRIADDGIGFDMATVARTGLLSMRSRADSIGAQVEMRSVPGETVVWLLIPRGEGSGAS